MTKWLLALCLALSATGGCLMETADQVPSADETAGSATVDVETTQSGLRYIDYGALGGNRAPCPPNQVMDLATHRCVNRPADIYRRGCIAITRCARG